MIFDSQDQLELWLENRGVQTDDASTAADVLYPAGFNEEDALLGISSDQLQKSGLSIALAMKLSNKLRNENRQPQQIQNQLQSLSQQSRDRENVALRKRVRDLEVQDSRAVSFTDYYKEKFEQERVQAWFPPSLDAIIELPTPLQGDRPQGSEKVTVKPDWESIVSGNRLVPSFSNGYEVGYVGPKIPDVAFYPRGIERPTAGDFVAFGDAKGNNWTGTSASEKGQVMMYGHRILDVQPQRTHVYGFITNNARVLLVRATRADESPFAVFWAFSPVLTFDNGMKIFFNLLQNDNGYVSPPSVLGSIIDIRRPLRPGGTCRAFGAVYLDREVVGKLYTEAAKAEEDASKLGRVHSIVAAARPGISRAQIPTVVGQEGQWLVLSPLGTIFTSLNFKLHHLQKLLNTLQIVHQANIIHRDVRFANIFLLPDDQVLLNDWGASTEGGSVQLVAGCPPPFCHSDLVDVADATPEPKHDLYSLVVAAAHLLLPGMSSNHYGRQLRAAFAAAENVNYEGVLRAFEENIF